MVPFSISPTRSCHEGVLMRPDNFPRALVVVKYALLGQVLEGGGVFKNAIDFMHTALIMKRAKID